MLSGKLHYVMDREQSQEETLEKEKEELKSEILMYTARPHAQYTGSEMRNYKLIWRGLIKSC